MNDTGDLINEIELKKAVLILRAINNTLRIKIYGFIKLNPECTVTHIIVHTKGQQAVISAHLALLRKCRIVSVKREGRNRRYCINEKRVSKINNAMSRIIP